LRHRNAGSNYSALQYNAFAAEVFTNAESSGDIREYTSGEMDCNKNQRLWHNLFVAGE
jgi:hypothetical protein